MNTILVTGAAGYIGSHTSLALLKAGYRVISLDNYVNSSPVALQRVRELAGVDATQLVEVAGDILDETLLQQLFTDYQPVAVIHFAGLKAVGESVQQPLRYYQNNVAGSLSLLKVMQQHGCRSFVFSSSATVYGENTQMPLQEHFSRSATNPYGQSKLMIELMLEDLARAEPDWRIAVLRYFNPVGADASGRIGEDPSGMPNNLMPFITQVAVGKRAQLQIFGNDYSTLDGTGVRDYIHVTDLAAGHVAALNYLQTNVGIEHFNLGSGQGSSVLQMVESFVRVNQVDVPYQLVARRPGDVAECYADPAKSWQKLGWKTEKSLDDMVRDSWNWQQRNPNGYRES